MQTDHKYPRIVYKYRNWLEANHKNVLLKNQLFFTSPKDFNDPFDCRITANFSLLNTDDKIKAYIDKKRIQQSDQFLQDGRNIERELEQFEHRIRNELYKVQEFYDELYFEGVDNHYGVLSLSERWNSILMWSHYGDHHRGYCIGFWEEKLRNYLVVTGGPVSYPAQNIFPEIHPMNDDLIETTIKQSHSKSNEWSYENEYRLTKIFYPEIPTPKDRIQQIPDDFFAEITIGLKTPVEYRDELMQIGKAKKIKVFQATKMPFKFEIVREEIV